MSPRLCIECFEPVEDPHEVRCWHCIEEEGRDPNQDPVEEEDVWEEEEEDEYPEDLEYE